MKNAIIETPFYLTNIQWAYGGSVGDALPISFTTNYQVGISDEYYWAGKWDFGFFVNRTSVARIGGASTGNTTYQQVIGAMDNNYWDPSTAIIKVNRFIAIGV